MACIGELLAAGNSWLGTAADICGGRAQLETQLKQRQAHIDELVVAERYKEAAVERDRMDTLRLRLRSINVQQNQARIARILYEPGARQNQCAADQARVARILYGPGTCWSPCGMWEVWCQAEGCSAGLQWSLRPACHCLEVQRQRGQCMDVQEMTPGLWGLN